MRIAGELKLGYFPAPPTVADRIATHLRLGRLPADPHSRFTALDPCAGEGAALARIASGVGIPESNLYAIELDPDRADAIRSRFPAMHAIGPASFLGSRITAQSFGLIYLNPPFADELGGKRREEEAFLYRATRALIVGGVIVFLCPFSVIAGNFPVVRLIDANYTDVALYRFPDGPGPDGEPLRKYNEVVMIGRKRPDVIAENFLHQSGDLHKLKFPYSRLKIEDLPEIGTIRPHHYDFGEYYTYGPPVAVGSEPSVKVWSIPPAWPPSAFAKIRLTDGEIAQAFATSPLGSIFRESPAPAIRRPPLPLNNGHLGMLLASGMLDGIVAGPDGAHVVRGSSHKVEYQSDVTVTEDEVRDELKTRVTHSETIVTTIRMIDAAGTIHTHSNGEPPDADALIPSDEDPDE